MLLQHPERFLEQIVEVHRVRGLLLFLVARLHVRDLLEQRQEIGKLFREQRIDRRLGVNDETENLGQHIAFRESHLLRIDSRRGDHGIDQILLIFAIHDGEPARIPERASMPAQHAISDRMKRAAPKSARVHRQQIRDAIEHLARGFVRKSEQQDIARVDAVLEQIRDAIGEGARLPAARAGDDQERTGRRRHRRELLLIQLRRVIDIDRGRGGSALERVFAGHRA